MSSGWRRVVLHLDLHWCLNSQRRVQFNTKKRGGHWFEESIKEDQYFSRKKKKWMRFGLHNNNDLHASSDAQRLLPTTTYAKRFLTSICILCNAMWNLLPWYRNAMILWWFVLSHKTPFTSNGNNIINYEVIITQNATTYYFFFNFKVKAFSRILWY